VATPYVGEIRMFGGNFAPVGWAFCNGQLMSISQNETLYALLGTIYGGDGVNTFALPDLQGRVPIHQGTDQQGNAYVIGQRAGSETVTLLGTQIPAHVHAAFGTGTAAGVPSPAGGLYAATDSSHQLYAPASAGAPVQMAAQTINPGSPALPHENLMPFTVVTFIIALTGVFPSQN
jgi:microcystin-dependent protein